MCIGRAEHEEATLPQAKSRAANQLCRNATKKAWQIQIVAKAVKPNKGPAIKPSYFIRRGSHSDTLRASHYREGCV